VKTQCQNLNGNPTQTNGVVRLTPNFVDHLVMFIKHGLHEKVTFQDIAPSTPSGKTVCVCKCNQQLSVRVEVF